MNYNPVDTAYTTGVGFEINHSRFAQIPVLRAPGPTPNLSNAIHPIFAEAKFPELTAEQYRTMDQPLRLASAMLDNDRALRYILTMADGRMHYILGDQTGDELTGDQRLMANVNLAQVTCRSRLAPGAPLTAADRSKAREILLHIANTLDRIVRNDVTATGWNMDCTTMDNAIDMDPFDRAFFPLGREGKKSYISVLDETMFGFQDATISVCTSRVRMFHLARILVHEVSHVLMYACYGQNEQNIFHEDSAYSEAGFQMETAIFGGVLNSTDARPWICEAKRGDEVMLLYEYPSTMWLNYYSDAGDGVIIRKRRDLDRYCIVKRVNFQFAISLFTNNFWNNEIHRYTGPLSPPDTLTWLGQCIKRGDRYYSNSGSAKVAGWSHVRPATLRDLAVPQNRQDWLTQIIQADIARHQLGQLRR